MTSLSSLMSVSALLMAVVSETNVNIGRYKVSCFEPCQQNEYKSGCDGAATVGKLSAVCLISFSVKLRRSLGICQENVTSAVCTALLVSINSVAEETHPLPLLGLDCSLRARVSGSTSLTGSGTRNRPAPTHRGPATDRTLSGPGRLRSSSRPGHAPCGAD